MAHYNWIAIVLLCSFGPTWVDYQARRVGRSANYAAYQHPVQGGIIMRNLMQRFIAVVAVGLLGGGSAIADTSDRFFSASHVCGSG